jgi:hypothetical protein
MANFAFSSYLFAWHVKLKRVKTRMFFSLFPRKSLKHMRNTDACLENALKENMPKMG